MDTLLDLSWNGDRKADEKTSTALEWFRACYSAERLEQIIGKVLIQLDRLDDFPLRNSSGEPDTEFVDNPLYTFVGHFFRWDNLRDELLEELFRWKHEKAYIHTLIANLLAPFETAAHLFYPPCTASDYRKKTSELLFQFKEDYRPTEEMINQWRKDAERNYSRRKVQTPEGKEEYIRQYLEKQDLIYYRNLDDYDCSKLAAVYDTMEDFASLLQGLFIVSGIEETIFDFMKESDIVLTKVIYSWRIAEHFYIPLNYIQRKLGGEAMIIPSDFDTPEADTKERNYAPRIIDTFNLVLKPQLLSICHAADTICVPIAKKRDVFSFRKSGKHYAYLCLKLCENNSISDIPWQHIAAILVPPADSDYLKKLASNMRNGKDLPAGRSQLDELITHASLR